MYPHSACELPVPSLCWMTLKFLSPSAFPCSQSPTYQLPNWDKVTPRVLTHLFPGPLLTLSALWSPSERPMSADRPPDSPWKNPAPPAPKVLGHHPIHTPSTFKTKLDFHTQWSQTKTNIIQLSLICTIWFLKIIQMSLFTKHKWTYRKQTYGYQWGKKWGGDKSGAQKGYTLLSKTYT